MPYHYSSRLGRILKANFEFFRFRFHFRALDAVHFPAGKSGNIIRGALGRILRDTASPAAYARLFEPGSLLLGQAPSPATARSASMALASFPNHGLGSMAVTRASSRGQGPSGLHDWPRPFILRAGALDGLTIPQNGAFSFDVHIFDLRPAVLAYFHQAFEQLGSDGIGPGHGRVALQCAEQVDLNDCPRPADPPLPLTADLSPDGEPVERVRLIFATPTELKSGGAVAPRPEFAVLFARLRDRISTLRDLYGAGPLEVDFRGMGERAAAIRLGAFEAQWERVERKSGRTGQIHPLGGFTGWAEYEGELAEFVPWLKAARWVGVGRQTVWGKGDVRVE
jgi:hypothetical protein